MYVYVLIQWKIYQKTKLYMSLSTTEHGPCVKYIRKYSCASEITKALQLPFGNLSDYNL